MPNKEPEHCDLFPSKDLPTPGVAGEQPMPTSDERSMRVLDRVFADLAARARAGKKKYGSDLKSHNGRDALMDAYQEALDLVQYLAQEIMEREDR